MCWISFGNMFASKIIGKPKRCGKCGNDACKNLVAVPGRGLYSVCARCGLMKLEWAPGDGAEELKSLTESHEASAADAMQALNDVTGRRRSSRDP